MIENCVPLPDNGLECDENCESLKDDVSKLLLKIDAFALSNEVSFGSLLRSLSTKLGLTFDTAIFESQRTMGIKNCQDISALEHKVHKVMEKVGNQLGINVSLHDLPNYYKVSTSKYKKKPLRRDQAFYSMCKANITSVLDSSIVPFCPSEWYDGNDGQIGKENPYLNNLDSFCSGGVKNLTRANLPAIMKAMKFAYHLATIDDLEELYDMMKKGNLPYAMKPNSDTNKYRDSIEF